MTEFPVCSIARLKVWLPLIKAHLLRSSMPGRLFVDSVMDFVDFEQYIAYQLQLKTVTNRCHSEHIIVKEFQSSLRLRM